MIICLIKCYTKRGFHYKINHQDCFYFIFCVCVCLLSITLWFNFKRCLSGRAGDAKKNSGSFWWRALQTSWGNRILVKKHCWLLLSFDPEPPKRVKYTQKNFLICVFCTFIEVKIGCQADFLCIDSIILEGTLIIYVSGDSKQKNFPQQPTKSVSFHNCRGVPRLWGGHHPKLPLFWRRPL